MACNDIKEVEKEVEKGKSIDIMLEKFAGVNTQQQTTPHTSQTQPTKITGSHHLTLYAFMMHQIIHNR